jgi:hypothetical protein
MHIDFERACTVFAIMLERYRRLEHPFIDLERDLPQTMVLPEIQADKLRFAQHLFFSCHYMRGTMISSLAFKLLNQMQQEVPWLFRLEEVTMVPLEEIEAALGRYIPWQKTQVSKLWQHNARLLWSAWGGDPRKIFKGATSKEDLYRRVMGEKYREFAVVDGKRQLIPAQYVGFGGFREKMTSMLAYFLSATKLIPPTKLSAPVDFHHLRIYLSTRMIESDEEMVRYEDINLMGIRLAEQLQKHFKLTQVEYGDIVWLWSLRSCRASPHNASEKVELEGRSRVKQVIPVIWTPAQVRKYDSTCGLCSIAGYCDYGVPPGPYYTTGKLAKVRKVNGPPQDKLFGPEELVFDRLPARKNVTSAMVPEKEAETKQPRLI